MTFSQYVFHFRSIFHAENINVRAHVGTIFKMTPVSDLSQTFAVHLWLELQKISQLHATVFRFIVGSYTVCISESMTERV